MPGGVAEAQSITTAPYADRIGALLVSVEFVESNEQPEKENKSQVDYAAQRVNVQQRLPVGTRAGIVGRYVAMILALVAGQVAIRATGVRLGGGLTSLPGHMQRVAVNRASVTIRKCGLSRSACQHPGKQKPR